MDRRCHRFADLLCPGQGPGAPHRTGPTAGRRHPASRPKMKRCLKETGHIIGRTRNLFFGTPSATGTLSIKMRRPLYIVKDGCDISMRAEPNTIQRRRRYRNNTSNKKCSTRTRTTTTEQLATRGPTDTDVMTHSVNKQTVQCFVCAGMVRVRACLCFERAFVCALEVRVRVCVDGPRFCVCVGLAVGMGGLAR